jgi:hypothetical protein
VFSLTLSWEGDFHKVATGAFGFVQHLVGFAQQGGPKTPSETPSSATELSIRIPDAVTDPLFETSLSPLQHSAFSRPTYYQAEADFQRDGLFGLLPEKRGPRQGHKLTPEVLDFAVLRRAPWTWQRPSGNGSL